MAFNKDDVIAAAQKYGPKKANKMILYVNKNKASGDNKPSLYGYVTDTQMSLSSVSLWKNKSDKGTITFSGNVESLGVKQNVVDIKPSEQEKDSLDDVFS
jgi:hypothetical protein